MVLVPGREQAAADQVVELALLVAERERGGRRGGGEDGMVIGDPRVVDEAAAERPLAGAGREQLAVGCGDRPHHLG